MKKFNLLAVALILVTILISAVACSNTTTPDADASIPQTDLTASKKIGDYAYDFLNTFNEKYNKRQAGSIGEAQAADYIAKEMQSFGYVPKMQYFSLGNGYYSQNIIIQKKGVNVNRKDENPDNIIVGAHYDSVLAGYGIDDNASGVAVMLEAAKNLASKEVEGHNITFIAFGSEEIGLKGSQYYVSQMSENDIKNTKFMVNLDTLAGGDKMYAYGGADETSQKLLSDLLAFGKDMKLETQQGLNPSYPTGTTGEWSDHKYFKKAGIPFIYFEATNWTIKEADGSYTDGYVQIEDGKGGYAIMHTPKDTLDYLNETFPGRVQEHMQVFTKCLLQLIK